MTLGEFYELWNNTDEINVRIKDINGGTCYKGNFDGANDYFDYIIIEQGIEYDTNYISISIEYEDEDQGEY